MKKIRTSIFIILFCLILGSCKRTYHSFGNIIVIDTLMSLKINSESKVKALHLKNLAIKEVKRLDKIFNIYNKSSELSIVNRKAFNKHVIISNDLAKVIKRALYYARLTNGAFDPTILPLKKLWNLKSSNFKLPNETQITKALKKVGYQYVSLNGNKIIILKKDVKLDLGGIAKGYIIDKVTELFVRHNIKNAIINIGGDAFVLGKKGKIKWRVGLQHPRQPMGYYLDIIETSNKAVVASGDYERFKIINNRRYHHIINPRTGMPARKCITTAVISDYAIDSDAISTAIFVLGPKKGIKLVNKIKNTEAVIVSIEKNKIKKYFSSNVRSVIFNPNSGN